MSLRCSATESLSEGDPHAARSGLAPSRISIAGLAVTSWVFARVLDGFWPSLDSGSARGNADAGCREPALDLAAVQAVDLDALARGPVPRGDPDRAPAQAERGREQRFERGVRAPVLRRRRDADLERVAEPADDLVARRARHGLNRERGLAPWRGHRSVV